jgi:hypothetical protein
MLTHYAEVCIVKADVWKIAVLIYTMMINQSVYHLQVNDIYKPTRPCLGMKRLWI